MIKLILNSEFLFYNYLLIRQLTHHNTS